MERDETWNLFLRRIDEARAIGVRNLVATLGPSETVELLHVLFAQSCTFTKDQVEGIVGFWLAIVLRDHECNPRGAARFDTLVVASAIECYGGLPAFERLGAPASVAAICLALNIADAAHSARVNGLVELWRFDVDRAFGMLGLENRAYWDDCSSLCASHFGIG